MKTRGRSGRRARSSDFPSQPFTASIPEPERQRLLNPPSGVEQRQGGEVKKQTRVCSLECQTLERSMGKGAEVKVAPVVLVLAGNLPAK